MLTSFNQRLTFQDFFMLIKTNQFVTMRWHTFSRLPMHGKLSYFETVFQTFRFLIGYSRMQFQMNVFYYFFLFSFFLTQMQIISFISECWKLLKHFLRMIWKKFFTKVWIKDSDNKTFEKNKKSVISRKVYKRIFRNFDDVL